MATTHFSEKGASVQGKSIPLPSSTLEYPFDRDAEKRLLRKLDFRILPVLWLLYLVNFIDRYAQSDHDPLIS
jgi:hypothetical protein